MADFQDVKIPGVPCGRLGDCESISLMSFAQSPATVEQEAAHRERCVTGCSEAFETKNVIDCCVDLCTTPPPRGTYSVERAIRFLTAPTEPIGNEKKAEVPWIIPATVLGGMVYLFVKTVTAKGPSEEV